MTLFSGHGVVYHDDCIHMFFFWCDDGMIVGKEGLSFGVCFPFSIFRRQHPIVQQRNVLFWFGTGFKSPARTVVLKRPVLTLRIHWKNTTIYAILACFYYLGFTSTLFVEIEPFSSKSHVAFMIPSLLLESLLDALPPRLNLRWYVPENATLFIVGDIDEEETIREATGRWWGRRNVTGRWNRIQKWKALSIPIGSMYGIFTYIWLIFMVNVGEYTIHGSYGIGNTYFFLFFFSFFFLF